MLLNQPVAKKLSISLTPLIDVVFILLLFFMLSSTFNRTNQFELQAAASGSEVQAETELARLLLLPNGKASLHGKTWGTQTAGFAEQLLRLAESEQTLIVAAQRDSEVQSLVAVLDQINAAGIKRFSLAESVE